MTVLGRRAAGRWEGELLRGWSRRGLAERLPSSGEQQAGLPALSPRQRLAFSMMEGPRHGKVVYWPCRVQGPHVPDLVPLPLWEPDTANISFPAFRALSFSPTGSRPQAPRPPRSGPASLHGGPDLRNTRGRAGGLP